MNKYANAVEDLRRNHDKINSPRNYVQFSHENGLRVYMEEKNEVQNEAVFLYLVKECMVC